MNIIPSVDVQYGLLIFVLRLLLSTSTHMLNIHGSIYDIWQNISRRFLANYSMGIQAKKIQANRYTLLYAFCHCIH